MMSATEMIRQALILLLLTSSAAAAQKEEPAYLPPAPLELRIDAPGPSGPWKMVVKNTGHEMLRLAADGRLLRLEVRPPATAEAEPPTEKGKKAKAKAKKDTTVECRAPAPLRPASVDDDRAVALPPLARYEETIDPALFCFDRKQREALVVGSAVVARLGFVPAAAKRGRPARQTHPYVAEPIWPNPAVSSVKEVVAAPFTIPEPAEKPATRAPQQDATADADPAAPRMEISAPKWIDSEVARSLSIPITVSNAGKRALVASVRTENVSFDVVGPGGSAQCKLWDGQRTLVRDFFKTMAPGSRESFTVLLGEVCPDSLFDVPGLYTVTPSITLPDEPGRLPVRSWTGTAVAKQPTVVRVRAGTRSFYQQPPQVLIGSAASN